MTKYDKVGVVLKLDFEKNHVWKFENKGFLWEIV
jgi:hypothetical protein